MIFILLAVRKTTKAKHKASIGHPVALRAGWTNRHKANTAATEKFDILLC